jgi:hypothetical protein
MKVEVRGWGSDKCLGEFISMRNSMGRTPLLCRTGVLPTPERRHHLRRVTKNQNQDLSKLNQERQKSSTKIIKRQKSSLSLNHSTFLLLVGIGVSTVSLVHSLGLRVRVRVG